MAMLDYRSVVGKYAIHKDPTRWAATSYEWGSFYHPYSHGQK